MHVSCCTFVLLQKIPETLSELFLEFLLRGDAPSPIIQGIWSLQIGSGQKGSVRRGSVKNWTGFFPGFSPDRYVSGTSPVRHDITRSRRFCVLSTFSNRFFPGFNRVFSGFFPGFNRVFSGFLKNLEKTWFNFHRPPPWPTPFGGPRPEHFQNSLPPSTAGDASFFRSGSGEGLSEPVMEFPAVLRYVWLGEGAKGLLNFEGAKSCCTGATWGCTGARQGCTWCKRLLGDLCAVGSKDLLHPLLTTFGDFPIWEAKNAHKELPT